MRIWLSTPRISCSRLCSSSHPGISCSFPSLYEAISSCSSRTCLQAFSTSTDMSSVREAVKIALRMTKCSHAPGYKPPD